MVALKGSFNRSVFCVAVFLVARIGRGAARTVGIAVAIGEVVNPVNLVFDDEGYDVDDKEYPTAENHKYDCKHDAEYAVLLRALCKTIEVCGNVPQDAEQNLDDFVKTLIPFDILFCKFFHFGFLRVFYAECCNTYFTQCQVYATQSCFCVYL